MRNFLTLAFLCAWPGVFAVRAAAQTNAVFIVDSTAQMAAKFGQKRRIDAVASAIGTAARRVADGAQLSVLTYGSEPAKKCDDVRELVPRGGGADVLAAISSQFPNVKPTPARAPVSEAIRSAFKTLGEDSAGTAILFTGSGDDCNADLCGAARALQPMYPKIKLHVVGIGASAPAADSLTCAAKALGGTFSAIKAASELDKVMNVILPAPPALPPKKVSEPAEKPEISLAPSIATATPLAETKQGTDIATQPNKAPAPEPEPNVRLTAILTAGEPALPAGVTWRVTKVQLSPTGQKHLADAPSWTGPGGIGQAKVAPGDYVVEADYGLSSAQSELSVGAEKAEKTVSLDAGTIAVTALQSPAGKPVENALFTLYRGKPSPVPTEVGRSSDPQTVFYVNSGEYRLSVVSGLAKQEIPVTVLPGKVTVVTLSLNLGILDIKAFAAEGQPKLLPAWHRLYTADGGGKRKPVLTIAGPASRVVIPAGAYKLRTEYGQVVQESDVIINPGQITSQTVILNAGEGRIHVAATQAGVTAPPVCAAFPAGGEKSQPPLARSAGMDVSFVLRAGSYDVECRSGIGPVQPRKATITIKAGETSNTEILR